MQSAKKLLCVILLAAGVSEVRAFSLLGPFDTWQTTDLGYNLTLALAPDVGGPMNIGEEYRWATPVVAYAYDPSFLNFFGNKGVAAVEAAIKILNDLPAASAMSADLHEFPMDTRRFNYRATALGIRDLKSWALSALLEAIGLTVPERYVFTLRARVPINTTVAYTVFKRNFDPVTFEPTSYVNGTLYTYNIFQTRQTPFDPFDAWEAVEIPVDPLAPTVTTVAAYAGLMGGTTDTRGSGVLANPGMLYSGLTRDDVGGIRYLLRKGNQNVENLPADASGPTSGASSVPGSGSGGLAWLPVSGGTGATTGGAAGAGQQAGGGVGAGAGAAATGSNAVVNTALRPGADKLRLIRVNFDSLLGQFSSNAFFYSDTYLTNGATRQQVIQRTLTTTPDILFTAGDLGVDTRNGTPILYNRTITFQNNNTLNSLTTPITGLGGPGNIVGPVQISFSKIGPFFQNSPEGREEIALRGLVWGSFDTSTNAPVIFPSGTTIQDLERIVLDDEGGGTPWRVP